MQQNYPEYSVPQLHYVTGLEFLVSFVMFSMHSPVVMHSLMRSSILLMTLDWTCQKELRSMDLVTFLSPETALSSKVNVMYAEEE